MPLHSLANFLTMNAPPNLTKEFQRTIRFDRRVTRNAQRAKTMRNRAEREGVHYRIGRNTITLTGDRNAVLRVLNPSHKGGRRRTVKRQRH